MVSRTVKRGWCCPTVKREGGERINPTVKRETTVKRKGIPLQKAVPHKECPNSETGIYTTLGIPWLYTTLGTPWLYTTLGTPWI